MTLCNIVDILSALSKVRKLFWSEDDFKFAFATQVKIKFCNKATIRLEKRYERDGKSSYTDIVVKMGGKSFPIELKYKTVKSAYADNDHEVIQLLNHGAVDLGCYAYLKDIERLEYLSRNDENFERGFAISLQMNQSILKILKRDSVYDAFKIYQGNTLQGVLDWKREAYEGKPLPAWINSHPPFELKGTYVMDWHSYSNLGFKYQVAEINKEQRCRES